MSYSVTCVRTHDDLTDLVPAWEGLWQAGSCENPFAHPAWLLTWAGAYVPDGRLLTLAVRSDDGVLVGVAPFYRRSSLGSSVQRLQLLGMGRTGPTELPQVLSAPGQERRVLRAVIGELQGTYAAEYDWAEVSLTPTDGWYQPQWIDMDPQQRRGFGIHRESRACVILPLEGSWDAVAAGFKRNLKESLRRARNRLKRAGHQVDVVAYDDSFSLQGGLEALLGLHSLRARHHTGIDHPDLFHDPVDRAFFVRALHELADRKLARIHVLSLDGAPAAALLTLHANGTVFTSVTGADPRWWEYSLPTYLQGLALRAALESGDKRANLSVGPSIAKLRWSESLEYHHDFAVVGPRRRSQVKFAAYSQAASAYRLKTARSYTRGNL